MGGHSSQSDTRPSAFAEACSAEPWPASPHQTLQSVRPAEASRPQQHAAAAPQHPLTVAYAPRWQAMRMPLQRSRSEELPGQRKQLDNVRDVKPSRFRLESPRGGWEGSSHLQV